MKPRVAIVDFQMGNLFSVQHACNWAGMTPVVTCDYGEMLKCDAALLPGVGAFAEAMYNLNRLGLSDAVRAFVASGKPFMGVCLGMQLLLSKSYEFGECEGLGIIDGEVVRFASTRDDGSKVKVPQIGWNRIYTTDDTLDPWEDTPLAHLPQRGYMYFVHSYYVVPSLAQDILSRTSYEGVEYCSSLHRGNVFAVQFHPEKSGVDGVRIYQNFRKLISPMEENNG